MLRRFLTPAPRYLSAARRAGRGGFTLVELMIAVAIGAFVIAALYALFVGQMRQFMYQDAQMEMHQNMRLGMDIMSRTTRMAGYGTGSSTRGPFGDGGDQDASLSAVISYDGDGPGGSDAITVVSMDPSLVFNTYETAPPLCSTTSLNVVPTVNDQATKLAQLQNGEMILCVDYAGIGEFRSYLWALSGGADASTGVIPVTDDTAYADYANNCGATDNLPLIMTCSRAEVATFYIDADDTDGIGAGSPEHPVLMMDLDFESPDADDIPVVDNVEDFQVAYCVRPSTGSTDCDEDLAVDVPGGDWVSSITSLQVDDLYMIRMTMVVRSARPDLARTYLGAPLDVENNDSANTPDHYYRQIMTSRVAVRNLRLQANL